VGKCKLQHAFFLSWKLCFQTPRWFWTRLTSIEHTACRALVELLGCERNGRWKSLLSCTHPLNTTGSLRSQFTDLKVFICCPVKEILDLQLSLGNFCTWGFLVLVLVLTLVISPTGMRSPCSVWISPLEALANHPSSKGVVCFSSEFLSHLSDTFLFGTNPWSFLFCWLSFQLLKWSTV